MGLSQDAIDLLMILHATGAIPERPAVIEMGAQQLSDDILGARAKLEKLGRTFGAESVCPLPPPLNAIGATGAPADNIPLDPAAPMARDFWTWLGFDYAAVDVDGTPGSLPLDLNFDDVPEQAKGRFDIVTNFGTTEHVANQLNAFKIIHELAAPGGAMLHVLPCQGMLNHGLINYNPKFFWMLSRSNGYKWLYANFSVGGSSYELPGNIIEHVRPFVPSIEATTRDYRTSDCSTVAMLQKTYDIAFVPPLDLGDGMGAAGPALERRYWTVFQPDAFATLPPHALSRRR